MRLFKFWLLFNFILIFCSLPGKSQGKNSGCSKCEAIKLFLNDPKVGSNFSHYNVGIIDSFVIVDLDSSLTECEISIWRGKPVRLLINGSLYDSVKKYWWPGLKIDKRKLFKFSMKSYNLLFIQGNGSLFSMSEYKIKKGKYFVGQIKNGVE